MKWLYTLQIPWFFYFLLLLHLLLHGILIILSSRKKDVTFTHCLSMKCLKAQAPDSLFLLLQKATKQQHSERSRIPRCYSCKEDKLGKENSLQRDLAWTQLHMSQSPQDINWEGYRKQKLSHARNELICTWHKPSEQCATDWDLTKGIHKMISGLDSLTATITFWMKEHPVVQSQNECAELQWKPVRFLSV